MPLFALANTAVPLDISVTSGRGLQSPTLWLNLSRFRHQNHPIYSKRARVKPKNGRV